MKEPVAVKNPEEIKDNVKTFNKVNKTNIKVNKTKIKYIEDLLRQSTYWVYDTSTSQFAPSKFVQSIGMDFPLYKRLTSPKKIYSKGFGGGGQAQKHIRSVTKKQFKENAHLRDKLKNWADQLGIKVRGVYKNGVNKGKNKWRFLEL